MNLQFGVVVMLTDKTLHDYENHSHEVHNDENGDDEEYARHLTEICYTHVLFDRN